MLTSSQVLNLSSAYEEFLLCDVEVVFLDEFRMMIYTPEYTGNSPEFTLFDTFVSQDRPTNFRRFQLPLKYCDFYPSVAFSWICLGTLNQDEPLTVDPTQAFLLLELSNDVSADAVIALRIETLVKQACLMDTGIHIPWRELERDAVVAGKLVSRSDSYVQVVRYVQGVHVIEMERRSIFSNGPASFRTFDFSRRGYGTLRDADGESAQEVRYEGGQDYSLEWSETIIESAPHPLGNGTFYCLVCGFRRWKAHEG